eukprot:CAMPEP_0174257004 /NCGR_PEP_ID=MMETSP0439-20130205/6182_1 /TAXON_ID=0 /ORGANISM="Stereomyxa ramosa, Strain Chinc5" /LENGTH=367 /DNA_ID=CAMNT_0015339885 /DNA_START=42 /DNA_END=1145 /DNA_ORIENTATION=-
MKVITCYLLALCYAWFVVEVHTQEPVQQEGVADQEHTEEQETTEVGTGDENGDTEEEDGEEVKEGQGGEEEVRQGGKGFSRFTSSKEGGGGAEADPTVALLVPPQNLALIVIDMQNDFCHPDGVVPSFLGVSDLCTPLVEPISELVKYFKKQSFPIVWVFADYDADKVQPNFDRQVLGLNGEMPCRNSVWGKDLIEDLKPFYFNGANSAGGAAAINYDDYLGILTPKEIEERKKAAAKEEKKKRKAEESLFNEYRVDKNTFDAFADTKLKKKLAKAGVETVVVVGVSTEVCVESTARRAFFEGFNVVVVSDAVNSMEPFHSNSLQTIGMFFGSVYSSSKLLSGWQFVEQHLKQQQQQRMLEMRSQML